MWFHIAHFDYPFTFGTGVHGDTLTILQAPEFVSFQKGDWPISGEKIPDLVALTMGFSVKEVLYYLPECFSVCISRNSLKLLY